MKKSVTGILLFLLMLLLLLPASALADVTAGLENFQTVQSYQEGTFTDVELEDWFHVNIVSDYELKLMLGREENFFDTDSYMTVAEALTIAARMHSIYYTGKADFPVSEPWYQVYTDYCSANGIANIADYDLNMPVTRAQFAEIFANSLPDEAFAEINEIPDDAIPDVKMGDNFAAAIYQLYRAGILIGNDEEGTYAPNAFIRRMEVAAITTRMALPELRVVSQEKEEAAPKAEKKEYTVTFDPTYGTQGVETVTVEEGEKVSAPSNPTRPNYSFISWYTESTGGNKFDFNTAITENITLYAHWSPNVVVGGSSAKYYTVSFEMNGRGGSIAPLTRVRSGSKITAPTAPTQEGYTFGGWYRDEALNTAWDFDTDIVKEDTTLYAKWTFALYTVTFAMNCHGTQIDPISVAEENSKITAPTAPTAEKYTFDGWFRDKALSTPWDFAVDTVNQDIALYAKWTRLVPSFKAVAVPDKDGKYTLYFYYDKSDHGADGTEILLFDELPTAAAKESDWGYNDIRWEITKVVIDSSVAEFQGLTSTNRMFYDMGAAAAISGAEYLKVDKVTDMNSMFAYFGAYSNIKDVPDVSGWNTENVVDMGTLFGNYGMQSSIEVAPDVSKWNTENVTIMDGVFECYGEASYLLAEVPNVRDWKTDKVTNMKNLFSQYALCSQYISGAPDVSKWNTENVTSFLYMFWNFGSGYWNQYFELDLSGWSLKSITDPWDVEYILKGAAEGIAEGSGRWKVFIPSKTGDKENDEQHWYLMDGENYIIPPSHHSFSFK